MTYRTVVGLTLAGLLVGVGAVACGGGQDPGVVRVLTHDSFDLSPEVVAAFEERSGLEVEFVAGGDAVAMVNGAILTAGNPAADVLFGVDNNQLSAAVDAGLFEPYQPPDIDQLRDDVATVPGAPAGGLAGGLAGGGVVTPIDVGDVCVNIDRAYFSERGLALPETLDDLADPAYAGLLVVQNPATSSPGLAFLLATVAAFGDDWPAYWERLVANDVAVADGWEEAYYGQFSGGSGEGTRPLVVSYATSPPAEVVFAADYDPANLPAEAPTGVATGTCYRQVEYAGVLAGASNPVGARQFIDFLFSPETQRDLPLTMFVVPARAGVELPPVFTRFSAQPTDVWSLPSDEVVAGRDEWVGRWRQIVLG